MTSRTRWIAVAAVIGLAVAAVIFALSRRERMPEPASPVAAVESAADETIVPVRAPSDAERPKPDRPSKPASRPSAGFMPAPPDSTPSLERSRELVVKLTQIDANRGPLTAADGAAMKQRFAELKAQGAVAVPAIREFLIKNQDLAFEASEVIDATGFPSLRLGFIDVLRDIEGPEAIALSAETLRSSGDPVEIATLAGILEKNEPGEHRQEAVKAARDALSFAAAGQLNDQHIGPAFEVLQTYGDSNVIPMLQDQLSGNWRQNAAIALAELPEGAGVPALLALAKDTAAGESGRGELALRPLAQVALRYPQAIEGLAQLAQENKIPDSAWPGVISALAGNDYISNGNILPETRPPSADLNRMLPERLALLDRLAAVAATPAAVSLLQQQRSILMGRIAVGPGR